MSSTSQRHTENQEPETKSRMESCIEKSKQNTKNKYHPRRGKVQSDRKPLGNATNRSEFGRNQKKSGKPKKDSTSTGDQGKSQKQKSVSRSLPGGTKTSANDGHVSLRWFGNRDKQHMITTDARDDNTEVTHTLKHYHIAIQACGNQREWSKVIHLFLEMKRNGIRGDPDIYRVAINAYRKTGKWESALELFHSMGADGVTPNLPCFHSAIAACRSTGQWKTAQELLRNITNCGYEPTENSYSVVMEACMNAGEVHVVLQLYNELMLRWERPGRHVMELAIAAYLKTKQLDTAIHQVTGAVEAGMVLREKIYKDLFRLCGERKPHLIYALVHQRIDHGHCVSIQLFNYAVSACVKAGYINTAEKLLYEMELMGYPPINFTFSNLIRVFGRDGEWVRSLENMSFHGLVPDYYTYEAVLSVCRDEHESQYALEVLSSMIPPDHTIQYPYG